MRRIGSLTAFIGAAVLGSATSTRADIDLEFNLGYSKISLEGVKTIDHRDGGGGGVMVGFRPFSGARGLRLGVGLQSSYYLDEIERPGAGDDFIDLGILTPSFSVAYTQPLGDAFFIEPSIAVGMPIANYREGTNWNWWDTDTTVDEWAVGISARPGVRLGLTNGTISGGIDLAYTIGSLEFDNNNASNRNIGGTLQEYFIGGFFSIKF